MLLGVIHILFAFPLGQVDIEKIYFIGSGAAIIFAGLINLICIKFPSKFNRTICILANLIMLLLFIMALTNLKELQVYIAIILFTVSTFFAIKQKQVEFRH
jgi:hypothetical protein